MIAEQTIDPATGKAEAVSNVEGVTRHEFGHAIDHAWGDFSRSAEFRAAYLEDVRKIHKSRREKANAYYLQLGHAGPQEAFAETFAVLHGGGAASEWTAAKAHLRDWPNVAAVIKKRIAQQ